MFRALMGAAVFIGLAAASDSASAAVDIRIDLSTQTMHVDARGERYDWRVSSARAGYSTPRGEFRPQSLQVMHYSRKYDNSPMPHSIFFKGGYAIHGTYETAALGRPASHGCVRLAPANAALLFTLVKAEGARIEITGEAPHRSAGVAKLRHDMRPAPFRFETPAYMQPISSWSDPFRTE